MDDMSHDFFSGGEAKFFKELGLWYVGPVDGHDLGLLIHILQGVQLPHLPTQQLENAGPHQTQTT
jgi:deoxyxylulose-5-phosphate synthase